MSSEKLFVDIPHPYTEQIGPIAHSLHNVTEADVRFFTIIRYNHNGKTAYQCFYKSSGANSRAEGTWFPCDGYLFFTSNVGGEELIAKLSNTRFAKESTFSDIVKLKLPGIRTSKEMTNMMVRFGCPLFMIISCILNGGIWTLEDFATLVMKKYARTEYIRPHHTFYPPNVTHLADMKDLNLFVRDAVSTNYMKEQYTNPPQQTIDYYDILVAENEYTIGNQSDLFIKMKARGMMKQQDLLKSVLYIKYKGQKFIPNFVIYDDITKMNPTTFTGLMAYNRRRIVYEVNKDEQQAVVKPQQQQQKPAAKQKQQKPAAKQKQQQKPAVQQKPAKPKPKSTAVKPQQQQKPTRRSARLRNKTSQT